MTSEETLAKRVRRRNRERVLETLQDYGVRLYALDEVRGGPSPHLAVRAILDRIIDAVEVEGK